MPKESEGPEGSLLPRAIMHCQLGASQDSSCRWSQSQETLPRPGPFLLDIGRGLRSGVAIWAIVARFQPNYLDFSEAITWPYLTSNSLTAPPQTSSEYKKCASFACPHSSGQFYFVILTYLQWSSYFSRKVASPLCAVLFPTSTKTTFWEMGPVLHLLWLLAWVLGTPPPPISDVKQLGALFTLPHFTWTEGRRWPTSPSGSLSIWRRFTLLMCCSPLSPEKCDFALYLHEADAGVMP